MLEVCRLAKFSLNDITVEYLLNCRFRSRLRVRDVHIEYGLGLKKLKVKLARVRVRRQYSYRYRYRYSVNITKLTSYRSTKTLGDYVVELSILLYYHQH